MILRELLVTFVLSVLFLNFTLMMEKLFRLSKVLAGVGASLPDIVLIIVYLQPQLLILTIPMSLLMSVLLCYGRMNADNELTILRISGMSFRAIARPVVYLGVLSFAVTLAMSFYGGPYGALLLRQKITEMLTQRAALTLEQGIFNTTFKGVVILVKAKPTADRLEGIFIVDDRKKDEQRVIIARQAEIFNVEDTIGFLLVSGHAYLTTKKSVTKISFERYQFTLDPVLDQLQRKRIEMTPAELLSAAGQARDTRERAQFMLEFHRRLSMPSVCLVLVFLGPPLAMMSGRTGKLGGLTVGMIVFIVYYTVLIYGENLARSGRLPFEAGAWLAFVLLSVFSATLFERSNRR